MNSFFLKTINQILACPDFVSMQNMSSRGESLRLQQGVPGGSEKPLSPLEIGKAD
jgi:hypothetical protein